MTDTERRRRQLRNGPSAGTRAAADADAPSPDDPSGLIDTLTADSPRGASAVTAEVQNPEPEQGSRARAAKSAAAARRGATAGRGTGGPTSGRGTSGGTATSRGAGGAWGAGVPEDRETERGLRGLIGSGASQVGTSAALRARDAARPSDADLAEAEERLVIVHRNWVPREDLPRAGR